MQSCICKGYNYITRKHISTLSTLYSFYLLRLKTLDVLYRISFYGAQFEFNDNSSEFVCTIHVIFHDVLFSMEVCMCNFFI